LDTVLKELVLSVGTTKHVEQHRFFLALVSDATTGSDLHFHSRPVFEKRGLISND